MLDMNIHGAAKRIRLGSRPSLLSPSQLFVGLFHRLVEWERRARERKSLAEMPDHMLKDLGITRSDAVRESDKPFWRP